MTAAVVPCRHANNEGLRAGVSGQCCTIVEFRHTRDRRRRERSGVGTERALLSAARWRDTVWIHQSIEKSQERPERAQQQQQCRGRRYGGDCIAGVCCIPGLPAAVPPGPVGTPVQDHFIPRKWRHHRSLLSRPTTPQPPSQSQSLHHQQTTTTITISFPARLDEESSGLRSFARLPVWPVLLLTCRTPHWTFDKLTLIAESRISLPNTKS